ncbi:hypothetical protein V6N13_120715 [Hibiscus sabdariffa]
MDPSSYHHHHHHHHKNHHVNHPRYVPFSPPLNPLQPHPHPHPQPPPPYQQSPSNPYPSRHHLSPQLRPPPPPPPPPPQQNQQQPYQPLLAPSPLLQRQQYSDHPPYNPHHPQYASNPNFNSNPKPNHVPHQFHDVPQRRAPEFDTRPDYWSENRLSRPRPVSSFDREAHYHHFDRRPASPGIVRFMHDLDGSSRFRDLDLNQREREDPGRVHNDRWISDRSSRDFGVVSIGFDSNSNNSRFDHEVAENMRRGSRLRDQLIESGNNEINERDEMRVFPRKNDYYDSEADRYSDKGSGREGNHEFNRTPRKQIQKKSALLRIQKVKPSHRSREDERSHYLGYHNEGKTGTFRGKDLVLHSDHEMDEEKREGTPVELDVSFKSNSLVAKAIVTSSPAPKSDLNLMSRNTKIRKVETFDMDSLSFQSNKGSESSGKLAGSNSAVKGVSGSMDAKQSEGKNKSSDMGKAQDGIRKPCLKGTKAPLGKGKVKKSSKVAVTEDAPSSDKKPGALEGKGTIPCTDNMLDGRVQTRSSGLKIAVGENKVEGTVKSTVSDKTGASVGKSSSLKANKKKIIVRKTVKKVVNSPPNLGNSELAKKGDQLVRTDISARYLSAISVAEKSVTPLKMRDVSASGEPVLGVDSKCSLEDSALILENEKVNGASKGTVSNDVHTDADPGSSVSPKNKRKRSGSTLVSNSSINEETNVDQGSTNAGNSFRGLHINSNIEEDHNEKPNETIKSGTLGVDDLDKQFYHNESNINCGLSRSEDIKPHGGTGFDSGSSSTQDKNINCDIDDANSGSRQVCTTPSRALVEDGASGELLEANCSVGSENVPHLPCVEETQFSSGSKYGDCSNHERSTTSTPDIGCVNSEGSNHEIGNGFVQSLGFSGPGIPNALESVECRDKCTPNIQKRKAGIGELELSSSALTNISAGSPDVLTAANCVNSTIFTSDIGFNPAEPMVSNIMWPDVGLQHSRDKVSILPGRSSNNTCSDIGGSVDGNAPEKKKRKISTSNSGLTSPVISQSVAVSDVSKSAVQVPSNFPDDLLQLEPEVKVSCTNNMHAEGIDLLHANSSFAEPSGDVGSFSDACKGDLSRFDTCSAFAESVAPSSPCHRTLNLGGEQFSIGTPVSATSNHRLDAMYIEGGDRGEVLVDTAEAQNIITTEVIQCRIIPEHNTLSLDKVVPSMDVDDDNHLPPKDDLPSTLNSLISGVDVNEVSATNSNDEAMLAPDVVRDVGSLSNLVLSTSTCNGRLFQNSVEKTCDNETLSDDKRAIEGARNSSSHVSDSHFSKPILKSNDVILTNQSIAGKAGLLSSHDSKSTISLNLPGGEIQGRKTQLSHVGPKSYPTRSSFVSSASKNATSSTSITKPRTWRRTDNSSAHPLSGNKPSLSASPMQRQMPAYIRKGNSLVRKPTSVPAPPPPSNSLSSSVYRLKSGIVDEVKKGTGPTNRADAVDLRTTGANTSFERHTTPPLSGVTKLPMQTSNLSGECTSSPLAEPSTSDCCETTSHPSSMEINDMLKSPDDGLKTSETLNRNGSVNNLEDWNEQNESRLLPTNDKRVTYVKPKSNQLVATSDCDRTSVLDVDKIQSFSASSDGYYKKRKNQLIRTALESHTKQAVTMSDDISNSVRQIAAKVISSRTFGKRRSNKVVAKTQKPSKFSLVWTLNSARVSNNGGNSLCYPKVRPQLFPWKRMAHKRSFKRKMLLLRKRNTVYTRSTNGFSIRKSKVLSVGGSSLKWSKSIEKNSRKANEEATLAVAEADRKKREQNGTVSGTGKKGHSCHKVLHGTEVRRGERIFRIGSVRYKMDSSRRSLQRISDDASSCSGSQQSENSVKRSYVPRRLVIGNDEYVRIGNGNQLVRDPKKRTRVLASEKVRWSLHTARLRLVKKRKYCQFFTRFGKCNKDDGKCPYIHDPSKISVCTKFLSGLCSNPNCKLTHKVIPERMPDCSYFLQGLCTNENCPYRHVHVNPKASACEGFLRGYCADGNECRKKHSYVCPNFEAMGSCPLGSKCKLHHPKNRSKVKKNKRSMENKIARGRYFGVDISEPKRMVLERPHQVVEDDNICFDGKLSDYINLDVSDDEAGELHQVICDQTSFGDSDSSDLQSEDLDKWIKPIRIMKDRKMTESLLECPNVSAINFSTTSITADKCNILDAGCFDGKSNSVTIPYPMTKSKEDLICITPAISFKAADNKNPKSLDIRDVVPSSNNPQQPSLASPTDSNKKNISILGSLEQGEISIQPDIFHIDAILYASMRAVKLFPTGNLNHPVSDPTQLNKMNEVEEKGRNKSKLKLFRFRGVALFSIYLLRKTDKTGGQSFSPISNCLGFQSQVSNSQLGVFFCFVKVEMGVEEGTSNGEGADSGEKIKCFMSEPVNNGLRSVFLNDSGDGSSGASENFRTYKRRRQLRSGSKIYMQDGGRASTEQVTHALTDHFDSLNDLNNCLPKKWRNVVLEHMHQLLSGDEGGIQSCIQDALLFHQENACNVTVKESDTSHEDKQKHTQKAWQSTSGTRHTAEGMEDVISNGSCKESNPQTTTEMCHRVFFDVLISEKFTSLCKLLIDHFQGIKLDNLFHLSLINSRMKDGVYERSPMLFSSDIQQVWRKLQHVGTEILSLAKGLSNISSTSYSEKFGSSGGAVEKEKHEESETLAGPEQIEACGVFKVCTCNYCGKKADGKDCLVCDSCEEMYHVACIEPALKVIPPKSWYCANCTSNGMGSPHENCVICDRLSGPQTVNNKVAEENCSENFETSTDLEENSNCSVDNGLQLSPGSKTQCVCKLCGSDVEKGEKLRSCEHPYCPNKYYHVRTCLVDKDDDKIVLCDGCDAAYHIYCLKPRQTSIPSGKWFCKECDAGIQQIRRGKSAYENKMKMKGIGGKTAYDNLELSPDQREKEKSDKNRGGMDMLLTAASTLHFEE